MTESEIRQFELQKGLEMKAEELARDLGLQQLRKI